MKKLLFPAVLIYSFSSFANNAAKTATPVAPPPVVSSAVPAAVSAAAAQAVPPPAQILAPPLSANEKKNLLSEFKKARSTAEKAMKHQEQSQVKELQSAQSMQSKQWREREKKVRREFFDAHLSGPERRKFVQDYLDKKSKYDQSLKDALLAKKKEWSEKNDAFKKRVGEQEIEFKKKVEAGERPGPELWPRE